MMRNALSLVVLSLLAGCSWFGDKKDEEVIEPAKLSRIAAELNLRPLWSVSVGKGAADKAIKLEPGLSESRVFAASADGRVVAVEQGSGRKIWEQDIRKLYTESEINHAFAKDVDVITGGVGAGEGLVLVGSAAGEVVALNQSDGSMAWRGEVSSEVLAPPQILNDLVVAQSIDGHVTGFDALSGERRWSFATSIPALTLRGTSTPILRADVLIAAFSNGRIALIDPERGVAAIDERIAAAKGRSDLERLVDIDGKMVFQGGRLYAVSYQGKLVAIDLSAGRPLWSQDASSVVGLGSGFGNVYLAEADDQLSALDMDSGRVQWETEALLHRDITVPVPVSSYVAVGDFEGYIHVLAQSDGRFVARRKVDGKGVYTPITADGSRLYVMGNSGKLSAFELQ
jgi:outer membrane protein assembly factor BamB